MTFSVHLKSTRKNADIYLETLIQDTLKRSRVYPFMPTTLDFQEFFSLLCSHNFRDFMQQDKKEINAWFFSRYSFSGKRLLAEEVEVDEQYRIVGYWTDGTVNSAVTFQDLVDDLLDALIRCPELDRGEINNETLASLPSADIARAIIGGEFMCNYVEIEITLEQTRDSEET